ncbi:MAG: aminotransferase class V-fold PLP-dependent enzyme [candidate division WOR-3 bacterium]|nr:aminotransferase class V-fold PLP-dependent enzyme [candidate division WOR-3 bacterium]
MDATQLFPRTEDIIYLNHASSSPLPLPARERMKTLIDELASGDRSWNFWSAELESFRGESAKLLGTEPREIGFIPNTSTGLLIALYSIPWRETDNIVLIKDGFPTNIVPWFRNLPQIQKRQIEIEGDRPLEDRILESIDEHTRAVAIDWVDFFTGYRIDLKRIGDFCKERGIFLVADGIQGCGALELDLSNVHVDFFAAASAKWLLGPVGAGILYVNAETMPRLKPAFEGWMSLSWKEFNIFDPLPPLKEGAGRFEPGSYPGVPLVGFVENLKILNSVGIAKINERIFQTRGFLLQGLKQLDAEIISPENEDHASGILTFRIPDKDSKALFEKLSDARIIVSLRKGAIRLSPHFYNTPDEASRVLAEIGEFVKS